MFTTDQEYSIPRNDQVLWRYMDFSKFVSMLEEESLYFCRADVLRQGDPYEGSLTRGEHIYRTAYNRVATDMIKAVSPLLDGNLIKHVSQEMHEKISIESYINCWHMNEQESLAMWKVYSNSEME